MQCTICWSDKDVNTIKYIKDKNNHDRDVPISDICLKCLKKIYYEVVICPCARCDREIELNYCGYCWWNDTTQSYIRFFDRKSKETIKKINIYI